MSDIEQARAILAEVRNGATPGPWAVWHDLDHQGFTTVGDADSYLEVLETGETEEANPTAHVYVPTDASLIVLMTNPALLDAIDGILAQVEAIRDKCPAVIIAYAERIASEIVTGWKAMQR